MAKYRILTILVMSSMILASCASETAELEEDVTNVTTDAQINDTLSDNTTEMEVIAPEIVDFGGEVINMVGFSIWGDHYLFSEELNGDILNDAIFERNSTISDNYNVELNFTIYDSNAGKVRSDVQLSVSAQDGSVDVAFPICSDAATLAIDGYLTDLYEIESIDLSSPWWDKGSVNELSIDNRLYFAINSLNLLADNFTAAVFFNKDMITDNKLENPYELVDSGKWTWAKMYEMAKMVSSDIDGDGAMTDTDTYGIIASYNILADGVMNCGEPIISKDSENLLTLAMDTERAADVSEQLFNIFRDSQNVLLVDKYMGQYNDAWQDLMYPAFKNGRGLFVARAYIQYVYYFRDSEVNYGILPRPKYDESQSGYYSDLNYAWANTVTIPKGTKDPEMLGLIIEALACESLQKVTPANYDVSIVNKQLRDTDSERMLDIIYSSRHYDWGQFTSLSDMKSRLINMLKSDSYNFVSSYEADKGSATAKIEKLIDELRE